jgi:hypothetical protein
MRYLTAVAAGVAAAAFAAGVQPAAAATLCVGPEAGCFHQIQPAVAAAHDGDTIAVARGTFAGGITIDKSIHLQGAGSNKTVINGGGPVVTILRAADPEGLIVTIDSVTITGGVNSSQPDNAVTFGGGVRIASSLLDHPPFNGTGATVTISNTVITGNTVTSFAAIPPGFCGPRACGFNNGGGIDNGGVLTLVNTRVTNNTSGSTSTLLSAASDAGAGGIDNHFAATLILRNSVVSGNRAVANSAIANHADSGGIGSSGALDIEDSSITGNTVEYRGSLDFEDQAGFAGGLMIDRCDCFAIPTARIRDTVISGNVVNAANTNPNAAPAAFAGGIAAFAPAVFDRVSLTDNTAHITGARVAGGDGGGMENDEPVTMRDSLVARNSVLVEAPNGSIGGGGGIAMFADLTLTRTAVIGNSVTATGPPGPLPFPGQVPSVFGGGITNGGFGFSVGTLTATDVVIAANRLSAGPGFLVRGGGLYTEGPVVRSRLVIAGNKPDDCFGC